MKARHLWIALLLCLVECGYLSAQSRKTQTITAEQAKDHVGETDRVCGQVASTHYAYNTRGHPTFLNFGNPYPHQVFTALIWGTDRPKFGEPDMILHSPKQITAK